jgi:hypothetical protein
MFYLQQKRNKHSSMQKSPCKHGAELAGAGRGQRGGGFADEMMVATAVV